LRLTASEEFTATVIPAAPTEGNLPIGSYLHLKRDDQEDCMHNLVGIFGECATADRAVRELLEAGIPQDRIMFLTGLDSAAQTASLPTTDAEPEGMGKAMGELVGGASGASAGLALGSALASLFVPGVGPIMAAGIGAAALLGLGGAAAGAKLGHESDDALDQGVPKDDVLLYRLLLQQGRSLVVVEAENDHQISTASEILRRSGAEDINEARQHWQAASSEEQLRRAS
jgi:hypothetical protein